jgi:hypothetical protein
VKALQAFSFPDGLETPNRGVHCRQIRQVLEIVEAFRNEPEDQVNAGKGLIVAKP